MFMDNAGITTDDYEVSRRYVFKECLERAFRKLGYDDIAEQLAIRSTSLSYKGYEGDIAFMCAMDGYIDIDVAYDVAGYTDDETFLVDNNDLFLFPSLNYYRSSTAAFFDIPWSTVIRPFLQETINKDGRYDSTMKIFDMKDGV